MQLSATERHVLALGRHSTEPPYILQAPRPSWLGHLFGLRRPAPLAAPRLEALRALAAAVARGMVTVDPQFASSLIAAGWAVDQLRSLFPTLSIEIPRCDR